LRTDAIAAFVAGFRFFYRTTHEQLTFFFGLLPKTATETKKWPEEGTGLLLETLCDRLAEWPRLSEILIDFATSNVISATASTKALTPSVSAVIPAKTASKGKRAKQQPATSTSKPSSDSSTTSTTSSETTSNKPVQADPRAFEFLEALISSALVEAKAKLASASGTRFISLSPTLRLLLALQKELCSGLFGVDFMLKYDAIYLRLIYLFYFLLLIIKLFI
jgi:hypothetical protein